MMQRRRFKQIASLDERLAQEAERLREKAKRLSPWPDRNSALRKARQAETASHLNEWLISPGLRSPE